MRRPRGSALAFAALAALLAPSSSSALVRYSCGVNRLYGELTRTGDDAMLTLFRGTMSQVRIPVTLAPEARSDLARFRGLPPEGRFEVRIFDGGIAPKRARVLSYEPVADVSMLGDLRYFKVLKREPCASR
jgi:hypothetical protein